jgi:thiol-disulfide isomerase/thioredoxin
MTTASTKRSFPFVPVIIGIAVVAIIAVVVLTFEGEASAEYGDPVITGDSLPFLPEGGSGDPALGMIAPEVTGTDFAENEISITHGDTAKIVLFLAHWCPHCQREVPIVQDWLDSAPLPDSVELISVSTSISSTRENFPPSAWLDREGWSSPVIRDDESGSVADAYGLTAFPYWVFLDEDGTVLARLSGGIATSDLDVAVATLQAAAAE